MKEIALEYEDFIKRLDRTKPIHYSFMERPNDKFASSWSVILNIDGIEKDQGWMFSFSISKEVEEQIETTKALEELIIKYVKPLNATLGKYEVG